MQNNKRYWLKGGVVGAILSVFIFFSLFSSFSDKFIPDTYNGLLDNIYFLLYFPVFVFTMVTTGTGDVENTNPELFKLVHYTSLILYGFILGVIVGWLYGKIRNRNKSI